ncbi:hypothetical protein EOD42_02430 [Rhodovarius crocodyli]|uniref:DUF5675 domain-containing protein n=1 Tax=Rhodovarius crocodyli TaxID=1979269 RepID=A0A437MMW7_9PROT|nr:hypothetical protein [Rhodovarius crocodyli]RVT98987.1 hypothetical protein EOD42_02430 [Rhodovarius crocodyli]
MADSVITYTRGNQYIRHIPYDKEGVAKPAAHGLVGTLTIGGYEFQTMERMDGYVHMNGDEDYTPSMMYWHSKYKSFVLNPWLGKDAEATKKKNILFHPASRPHHLEGCVGVGFFDAAGKLEDSKYCFDAIWNLMGGTAGDQTSKLTFLLRVVGQMKAKSACTPFSP